MAPKLKGLGRGLDALIVNTEIDINDDAEMESLKKIAIDEIKPNENQPRKSFDEDKISELADSINEHGVIQPIVVRTSGDFYEIVAGERRWRAARKAGLEEIPCVVRELSDEENMLFAIIENMQREDLNPVEEAQGLEKMISSFGLTQEEVSKSVGKSRPYITNSLRLLKLPEAIQEMMSEGKITAGHGRALINIDNEKKQIEIANLIVKEGLSVRQIEELAKSKKKESKPKRKAEKSADVLLVERELKSVLGTKVNIAYKNKKNTVEIECYNRDELNRIIELLKTLG